MAEPSLRGTTASASDSIALLDSTGKQALTAAPELHSRRERPSWWSRAWQALTQAGLGEVVLRLGTHALVLSLILLVAWGLRELYLSAEGIKQDRPAALVESIAQPLASAGDPRLAPFEFSSAAEGASLVEGIPRLVFLHTDAPSQMRLQVITMTVQAGDTVFGIAEKYGLRPETLLWSNQFTLGDNPHNLQPGQVINILPVDGAYHRWSTGEGLAGVASFYGVAPEDIISFPGNHLDPANLGDWSNPGIPAGTWLVIPGGRREFVNWSAPVIPLEDPSVAKVLGPGACEAAPSGVVGTGSFVWPVNNHFLSGFEFNPQANHPAVDLDGDEGDPVYATDSGVVVYAGWNDWGYGYMVVISHGNGWQSLYAHLSSYSVAACGQNVFQGNLIGAVGATGNATGPHLHFELMYNGVKVNPLDYMP